MIITIKKLQTIPLSIPQNNDVTLNKDISNKTIIL